MFMFDEPQRRRKSFSPELKKELFKTQRGKMHVLRQKNQASTSWTWTTRTPGSREVPTRKETSSSSAGLATQGKGTATDRQFRTKFKAAGVPTTQTPPAKTIPQSKFEEIAKKTANTKAKRSKSQREARQQDPFGFFI